MRRLSLLISIIVVGCAAGGEDGDSRRDAESITDGWSVDAVDDVEVDSTTEETTADPDSMSPIDSTVDSASDDASIDSAPIVDSISDSATMDSTMVDTGSLPDTGPFDTGAVDTGPFDTGPFDTGAADTGPFDTGPFDTGAVDTGPFDTGAPDTYVDPCAIALSYDFEASDQGFTHAPLSTYASDDPWARGTPTSTMKCHGGTGKCFTTGLTANYATCQTAALSTPVLDVSKCAASSKKVTFSFWHYYDFEALSSGHYWDGGVLQVSTNGTTWTDVTTSQPYDGALKGDFSGCTPVPLIDGKPGWSGTIGGGAWKQVTYDVPVAQRVATLRFRFLFGSDAASNKRGWYVDDVALTSSP